MKIKPWSIIVLAILHWISPVGNILLNSFQSEVQPLVFVEYLFLPQNLVHLLVLVVLPILSGICIFQCQRWSYSLYIFLMMGPFIYSFVNAKGNFSYQHLTFLFLLYLTNISIVGYFMLPNIRKIYFNPRLRWWETRPRFITDFKASLVQTDQNLSGEIKNISVGGFFIETSATLKLGLAAVVSFKFENQQFEVKATPVFQKTSTPVGYGFKIENRFFKRSNIRQIVTSLKSQGALVEGLPPTSEDSFTHWIKKAWKSKKAWVPDIK